MEAVPLANSLHHRQEPMTGPVAGSPIPTPNRADSLVSARFAANGGPTHLASLFERGSLRLRLPRVSAGRREAVLVNTGGGIAGGDRLVLDMALDAGAEVVASTQAAEKIYRAEAAPARIDVRLDLASRARLDWLPQETILFRDAACVRRLEVAMAADAELTLLETLVLGRVAHGEEVSRGIWRDRWRIARAGRLILAEDVRLEGPIAATMARPALGGGARAIATLVHVAPDAARRLEPVRAALHGATHVDCGASAWNGMLVVRLAGADPAAVRAAVAGAAIALGREHMPRSWSC